MTDDQLYIICLAVMILTIWRDEVVELITKLRIAFTGK